MDLTSKLRGIYFSTKELINDNKPVQILITKKGIYEIRKMPLVGIFSRRMEEIEANLEDDWMEGLYFALPKIPLSILHEVMDYFRRSLPNEAMAYIRHNGSYYVSYPEQISTDQRIFYNKPLLDDVVVEIHSHGFHPAFFSEIDNEDEKATGIYAVMGRINTNSPEIKARISCGGYYIEIEPAEIFDFQKSEVLP